MGSILNHRPVVIMGSILLIAALIISINTKVCSMFDDGVFVGNDVYIIGCIINPGVVSPCEYIYSVRMAPRDGRTETLSPSSTQGFPDLSFLR